MFDLYLSMFLFILLLSLISVVGVIIVNFFYQLPGFNMRSISWYKYVLYICSSIISSSVFCMFIISPYLNEVLNSTEVLLHTEINDFFDRERLFYLISTLEVSKRPFFVIALLVNISLLLSISSDEELTVSNYGILLYLTLSIFFATSIALFTDIDNVLVEWYFFDVFELFPTLAPTSFFVSSAGFIAFRILMLPMRMVRKIVRTRLDKLLERSQDVEDRVESLRQVSYKTESANRKSDYAINLVKSLKKNLPTNMPIDGNRETSTENDKSVGNLSDEDHQDLASSAPRGEMKIGKTDVKGEMKIGKTDVKVDQDEDWELGDAEDRILRRLNLSIREAKRRALIFRWIAIFISVISVFVILNILFPGLLELFFQE